VEESEVEEEITVLGVSESEDRKSNQDDTNKSADDGDDEGEVVEEEEEESHEVSSDADRTGGAGAGGGDVPVAGEDVVWIDGAPYLDIVSSSSSQFRGETDTPSALQCSALLCSVCSESQ
jgi:hypothetical protein